MGGVLEQIEPQNPPEYYIAGQLHKALSAWEGALNSSVSLSLWIGSLGQKLLRPWKSGREEENILWISYPCTLKWEQWASYLNWIDMITLFQTAKKLHNLDLNILMPQGVCINGITLQSGTLSFLDFLSSFFKQNYLKFMKLMRLRLALKRTLVE